MAVTIGHENISDQQQQLLETHRGNRVLPDLMFAFERVVTDSDIVEGREDLHPDWLLLFDQHRQRLQHYPRLQQEYETIRRVFESLRAVDASVRDISPEKEQIVFLLGAGASKPSPSNIPTVADLLPDLLRRARRLDREQVTNLADFCGSQGITNIEDLLTAVQISAFCSRNPRILRLVTFQLFGDDDTRRPRTRLVPGTGRTEISSVAYVQDTLQILFGLLSNLMLPAKPNEGHQAIVEYLDANPRTPIVTTNYDCCIDLALIENNVPFLYAVEFANPDILTNRGNDAAPLIKLHGSLNWFYCETCQKVWLIDIANTVTNYNKQRGEYPIISVCSECGGQRRGLLVPPHAMKFDVAPPLQPLIASAATCFENKSLIVVIGFSFADADMYISRMLIKAMQISLNTRMVIIDPDPEVVNKIRRKFEAQIPDFDSSRILKLQGDCSQLLPQFLSGKLKTPGAEAATEPLHGDITSAVPSVT